MNPGERTALPKRRQNPKELVRQPEAGLCPLPHSHTSGHQSRAQTSETAPRGSQGELACMKAAWRRGLRARAAAASMRKLQGKRERNPCKTMEEEGEEEEDDDDDEGR